jgi:hypothetical protein
MFKAASDPEIAASYANGSPAVPAYVIRRVAMLKSRSRADGDRTRAAFCLSFLHGAAALFCMSSRGISDKDTFQTALKGVPSALAFSLRDEYCESIARESGRTKYSRSSHSKMRLLLAAIVIALHHDGFSVYSSELSELFQIHPNAIKSAARELGCSLRTPKGSYGEPGATGDIVLRTPLRFPPPRRGRSG